MIFLKSDSEIEVMAQAGRIAGLCLQMVGSMIEPGITTRELDAAAEAFIRKHGAIPTFKGYQGFPATICASVNEVVVHGTPDDTRLKEGDIVSIDVGATYGGFVGDTAMTFPVGKISPEASRLLKATSEALALGIAQVRENGFIGDIGYAISQHVRKYGFSVVRDYAGHGVGRDMHEEPSVPNFGIPGMGPRLRRGMVIAIEPMVNVGTWEVVTYPNMRVVTRDGSLSAHFEHTVAVTSDGPRCLTLV
ncbi:MAG TPA: type I methionyl aminopeptidase [Firmicutes bacterium]|nr:type I methionyl aminopeptidase [Candidatus Fermentithermobacillaceae bacterium]